MNCAPLARRAALLLPALVVGLVGCGGESSRVPTHPARGQVFLDGQPIPHALVIFHPKTLDPNVPRPRATVASDGSFVVETYDSGDGAPAGEYDVTVEWWLSRASARTPGSDELPPINRLPSRYSKTSTSGLRVRIQDGENQIGPLHLCRS